MSDKHRLKKFNLGKKSYSFFNMDWKTKMRSQLGAFTDSYVSTLPHPCMAEELAEWSTKKEIVSKTDILETIEF